MNWIKVTDRLPAEDVDCWVYGPRGKGSEGGPYFGVAMVNKKKRWECLRSFVSKETTGIVIVTIDRREYGGAPAVHTSIGLDVNETEKLIESLYAAISEIRS